MEMIRLGSRIDVRDANGFTPLLLACKRIYNAANTFNIPELFHNEEQSGGSRLAGSGRRNKRGEFTA
jgi:hypothetical protein